MPSPARRRRRRPARKKLSFKEQREFDALPAQIEALEAEQQRLRHESESAEFYKERAEHIAAVLARIDQIAHELEGLLARWIELEERTGSATSSRTNS